MTAPDCVRIKKRSMKPGITGKTRLYLIAAVILVIGLGGAVPIYLAADNNPDRVLGYEIIGGKAYPIMPEDSKVYMHDLELYGGKANVLAAEFLSWFGGLWRGKSLAFTVAFLTIIVSFGFFIVANHLPSGTEPGATDENDSK